MRTGIGFTDKKPCKLEKANDGLKVTRLSMAASLNPGHPTSPSPLLCVCFTDPHSQDAGQGVLGIPGGLDAEGEDSRKRRIHSAGDGEMGLCESLATSP